MYIVSIENDLENEKMVAWSRSFAFVCMCAFVAWLYRTGIPAQDVAT